MNSLPEIHYRYMQQALLLAEEAARRGEVPVGAIIVSDEEIIGKGYNQVEQLHDPTAHAEMIAISAACMTTGEKHLANATLYVTLEPCPMCAGALVLSRIKRVVFGALDAKSGACGSMFNISSNRQLNHQAEIIQGVLESDCAQILSTFFEKKRSERNLGE
ncbi:MAG: tRNA adenosine(34) deaminase TadA [Balneolaceae bacterium]